MAWWTTVKAWLQREAVDLSEAKADLTEQLDADLTVREQRLNETPAEAMQRLQAEIAENDATLDALGEPGSDPDGPDRG